MTPDAADDDPSAGAALAEARALQQFLHHAPVGLMRTRTDGEIVMMNPAAARLLAPLGVEGMPNVFRVLAPASTDVQLMVQAFDRPAGVACDELRVLLPQPERPPHNAELPLALGVTVMRVSGDQAHLMWVLTDQSAAVRLQRLQAGWMR